MTEIADQWAQGDAFGRIVEALRQAGKSTQGSTIEDLSPIDHHHARGRTATVELADMLAIRPEHLILDIAKPFAAAADGLTQLAGMSS